MNTTFQNEHIIHNGKRYIPESEAVKVYDRIYKLLKDQKEYFKTKSQTLCASCKKREAGFIKWYEQNYLNRPQQQDNQQEMNL